MADNWDPVLPFFLCICTTQLIYYKKYDVYEQQFSIHLLLICYVTLKFSQDEANLHLPQRFPAFFVLI